MVRAVEEEENREKQTAYDNNRKQYKNVQCLAAPRILKDMDAPLLIEPGLCRLLSIYVTSFAHHRHHHRRHVSAGQSLLLCECVACELYIRYFRLGSPVGWRRRSVNFSGPSYTHTNTHIMVKWIWWLCLLLCAPFNATIERVKRKRARGKESAVDGP